MAGEEPGYDAFVSYSHQLDAQIAARLQAGLQRFAKPWYKLRALRVFRDETSLAASPELWTSIEEALSESRWMILMASPESAQSGWVAKEIAWWRAHQQTSNLLVALTSGNLVWDQRASDLDWTATTALSREALGQVFNQEPRWVDLRWAREPGENLRSADPRLQGAVADLAATIRHIPKDSLIGEHVRQQRKTRRTAITAVISLLALLIASVAAAFIAKNQSDRATRQATIAEAGLLAATAKSLTGSRLDLAQLFAANAYQLHPDAQTKSALYDAVQADPHLVRFLPAGADVSAVATSASGRTVVAGTTTGLVQRWQSPAWKRTTIARLHQNITKIAVSANGQVALAMWKSGVDIWQAGKPRPISLRAASKTTPKAVGVSPSGRFVVISANGSADNAPSNIYCFDLARGRRTHTVISTNSPITNITVPSESQTVALQSGSSSSWYRLAIPSLTKINAQRVGFPLRIYGATLSSSGRFVASRGVSPQVSAWITYLASRAPASPHLYPDLIAQTGGYSPTAIALSQDGKWVADAETGGIYVSSTVPSGHAMKPPLILRGVESVNQDALIFVGSSDSHLISASGSTLAIWNLRQYSRIAGQVPIVMPEGCTFCTGPRITVSPDGQNAIITDGTALTTYSVRLGKVLGQERHIATGSYGDLSGPSYGPAVWSPDGKRITFFYDGRDGGQIRSAPQGMAVVGRLPGVSAIRPAAATLEPGGRQIIEVDSTGKIWFRNSQTGRLVHEINGPASMKKSIILDQNSVAIDSHGATVAIIDTENPARPVYVINARTGKERFLPKAEAWGIGYGGGFLLIQRADGTLQVRSADGSRVVGQPIQVGANSTATPIPNAAAAPVANAAGLAVVARTDGNAVIADINSGSPIGVMQLPHGPRTWSTTMAFTPDGKRLIMVTEGGYPPRDIGRLTQLDLSAVGWLRVACSTAGRDLTAAEWREYIPLGVPQDLGCGT